MPKQNHIHKFKLHTYKKSGNRVFFCTLPDCSVKQAPAFTLGKKIICWRCGEPFLQNEYSIRLVKPHCEKCHKPAKDNSKSFTQNTDNLVMPIEHPELSHPVDTGIPPNPLAERLSKIVNQANQEDEEEI